MSEREEPDWLVELAKGGEALRRKVESIVQAAEQFGAQDSAWPLARRITRAVDAAVRELRSADEPVFRNVFDHDTAAATDSAKAIKEITGTLNIALPPMRVSLQGMVQSPPSRTAERSIGQILALVLVAMAVSGLLAVPGPDRAAVDHYLTVIGVALPIAWYLWNKQK